MKIHVFFPFVETSSENKAKLRLAEINALNIIEWKKKVAIELRADNPNYTTVLQCDQPRWYSAEENTKIRALLHPVIVSNVEIANLHEAVVDPMYRRAPATAALILTIVKKNIIFTIASFTALSKRHVRAINKLKCSLRIDLMNSKLLAVI